MLANNSCFCGDTIRLRLQTEYTQEVLSEEEKYQQEKKSDQHLSEDDRPMLFWVNVFEDVQ